MKKLPIGLSDFKRVMEENYYYVDKTLLVKKIKESSASIILLPRPRRFGKTLNMSMLRYFFEKLIKVLVIFLKIPTYGIMKNIENYKLSIRLFI